MGEMLIDFLILGELPGTAVRVEFWQVLCLAVICGFVLLYITSARVIKSSLRLIDPYRGAPTDMSEADIISL